MDWGTTTMADLFISYASEDRDCVSDLVEAFEQQGWTVWWDRYIDIGSSFDARIEQAIDEAQCIVVLWSRNSIKSDWVRAEAAEGLARNILVPVLLEEVKPPLLFRQKQAISLVDWRRGAPDAPLSNLLPSIAAIIERYNHSTIPVSTQRAWVLGREQTNDPSELANAAYVALSLGLSYFDDLFVYTSDYRGEKTHALTQDQLHLLVEEEGLDGHLIGEVAISAAGYQLLLHIHSGGTVETLRENFTEPAHLPAAVAKCLTSAADKLQGGQPVEGELMIRFLDERETTSLHHYWLSFQYAANNDYAKVRDACEDAIKADPGFLQAYRALATSYQYMGRFRESREAILHAIENTELESSRNRLMGRALYYAFYTEDYEKAVAEFEALIRVSPLDESAINNLAVSCFYMLDFKRAQELSARDLALYPMKLIGRQNAAYYSLYAGDLDEASILAERVYADNPAYINSLVIQALVAAVQDGPEAAEHLAADRFASKGLGESEWLQVRADIAMGAADWNGALALLKDGIAIDQEEQNAERLSRKTLMMAECLSRMSEKSSEVVSLVKEAIRLSDSTFNLASAAVFCSLFGIKVPKEIVSALKLKTNIFGKAYKAMTQAIVASDEGDMGDAAERFDEALRICDLWLIRFCRVHFYTRASMVLEARDELANCRERLGESLSAALDEQPTYRYHVIVNQHVGG